MPAHIISIEMHNKLIDAFRSRPAHFSHAAKVTGASAITARRYWLYGHPDAKDQRKKPIEQILREETEAARARLVALQDETERLAAELEAKRRAEAQALAMKDATESRVQEGQLVRVARTAATNLLVGLARISQSTGKLGAKISSSVDKLAASGKDLSSAEMAEMVQVLTRLTQAIKQANDAGRQVMDMERLLLGDPASVIHHVHHLGDVSVDEAERRIKAGMRALERAKAKGLVIDGQVVTDMPEAQESFSTEAQPFPE